jgi:hypothetical protein
MRQKLRSIMFISIAAMGMAGSNVSAFAANGDSSSSVRGSLGASLGDLSLDDGGGIWAFFVNAIFALAFVIVALRMVRPAPRQSGSAHGTNASASQATQSFG